MYTTYQHLADYFSSLPNSVSELKSVVVGDDEAILNTENTRIIYPALWVETPTVTFSGPGEDPAKVFSFAITVLENEPSKTPAEANATLSRTLEVLERVWARIIRDAEEDENFEVILKDGEAEPITQWSADNAYGWRCSMHIHLQRCECAD